MQNYKAQENHHRYRVQAQEEAQTCEAWHVGVYSLFRAPGLLEVMSA